MRPAWAWQPNRVFAAAASGVGQVEVPAQGKQALATRFPKFDAAASCVVERRRLLDRACVPSQRGQPQAGGSTRERMRGLDYAGQIVPRKPRIDPADEGIELPFHMRYRPRHHAVLAAFQLGKVIERFGIEQSVRCIALGALHIDGFP